MPTVTAWQHIYSNVEASDSPANKGGFQTLFYTHEGLTQEDVRHIEKRVFYLPGDSKPTKRVFFTLPDGHVVLGAIVPLEGRDSAGRTGRHLAHCYIIPRSTFDAQPCNIVAFLRSSSFYTTLDEVFRNGDISSGNIPAKHIDIISPEEARSSRWEVSDMLRLLHVAYQSKKRGKNGESLALIGKTDAIEETLMAAMTLLPNALLPSCSFDTVFQNGGNIRHTYYWATGLDRAPRQQTTTAIDVTPDTTSLSSALPTEELSIYEQWIEETIKNNSIDHAISHKENAYPLCLYIEGNGPAPNNTPDWITERLVIIGAPLIRGRLRKNMEKVFPIALTEHIFDAVWTNMGSQEKLQALDVGFKVESLLPMLFQAYENNQFTRPDRTERATLEDVLAGYPHTFLSLILALWNNNMDEVSARLELLDEHQYATFLQKALPHKLAKHKELLVSNMAGTFFNAVTTSRSLESKEIISLAKDLIDAGAGAELNSFVRLLPTLNKKELKSLKKLASKQTIDPILLQEIENLLNLKEDNQGGLFKIFRSR